MPGQVKANSVKQEYEKQDELKRSAMRAVAALLAIPGADRHPQLGEFITQIRLDPKVMFLDEFIEHIGLGGEIITHTEIGYIGRYGSSRCLSDKSGG